MGVIVRLVKTGLALAAAHLFAKGIAIFVNINLAS
jgi:hypothetical protein